MSSYSRDRLAKVAGTLRVNAAILLWKAGIQRRTTGNNRASKHLDSKRPNKNSTIQEPNHFQDTHYLKDKPRWYTPDPNENVEPIEFGLIGKDFSPRNLIVRTGQRINFINKTDTAGNIHLYPQRNNAANMVLRPNDTSGAAGTTYKKVEKIPVRAGCDFYTWMRGHHLPLDHPFAAVTDRSGRFKIEGLPPGEHTFRVWHEHFGWLQNLKITVPKEPTTSGKFYQVEMNAKPKVDKLTKQRAALNQQLGNNHPAVRKLDAEIRSWNGAGEVSQ